MSALFPQLVKDPDHATVRRRFRRTHDLPPVFNELYVFQLKKGFLHMVYQCSLMKLQVASFFVPLISRKVLMEY